MLLGEDARDRERRDESLVEQDLAEAALGLFVLQRERVLELLRGHGSVANEQRPERGPLVARAS